MGRMVFVRLNVPSPNLELFSALSTPPWPKVALSALTTLPWLSKRKTKIESRMLSIASTNSVFWNRK